jgi:hypothetical protein
LCRAVWNSCDFTNFSTQGSRRLGRHVFHVEGFFGLADFGPVWFDRRATLRSISLRLEIGDERFDQLTVDQARAFLAPGTPSLAMVQDARPRRGRPAARRAG